MKRVLTSAFTSVLLILTLSHSFAQSSDTSLAKRFIELNNLGKFDSAKTMFAPEIQSKISSGMLHAAWIQITTLCGKFNRILSLHQSSKKSVSVVRTDCDFEKKEAVFTLSFNSSHFLEGFFMTGTKEKAMQKKAVRPIDNTISVDTSVEVNGGKVYGTLLIPTNEKSYPMVLIIAGSGPTDRDGNSTLGEKSNVYLMLADSLAVHGIASFRYDKRYSGESTDFPSSGIEKLSFDDYVNDAVTIIHFLRHEPHCNKLIIAGHSEGSLIGMIAAQKTSVDAYISLAGAGENLGKILKWQLDQQPGINKDTVKNIIDKIGHGQTVTAIPAPLKTLFLPYLQHYMFTEMQYDPAEEIKKLLIPILIVNGTTDLQVNIKQAKLLHRAKPDAILAIIPGMNHLLKDAPEDRLANLASYDNPNLPLDDTLVKRIVQFIGSVPSHNHS